ncbi:restriction endonuclease subunit S [Ligilactobacillus salivarius]|uniref:restriction endonuclease subunit S n=1 Tax=Ligilactobacillus salivarius TaxID=1624 RepID=UPI0025A40BE6|nr:restriction endonuclease subunit S [Ligilactobacillus salivarius]MDM8273262.1 restriction endonuclease subunit S [Ligilactobacillus salivarius]
MTKYRLGEIVDIKYGKDHKKLNVGKIPVYGTGGIMRYVDNYLYDGESVLIPRKGSLNNIYYVVGKFWTVDTIFWTVINKNIILPKYLFYFLKRIDFEKLNVGSAVPSLTQKILNEIQIDIPSIEKQKDIIDKISVFERKINLNNKINSNLLELTALLWKNKFSLYKETTTIESYGKIISGGTPSKKKSEYYIDGTISWITPKDLSNSDSLYIDRGALNITDIGLNQSSAKLLKKGTILYSSRAPIGYIAIAARELSTNQGFKSIQPYEQKYTEFLYHLMKFVTPNIINSASGSTFKEISMVGMKAIKVPKVSEKDIESYHFIVKPLFDKIRLVEQENIKLKKLKNTLLVKLLN